MASERIFEARRGAEVENVDLATTRRGIERRLNSETTRYKEYYGIDWLDPRQFDLVIDTEQLSLSEVVDAVIDYLH